MLLNDFIRVTRIILLTGIDLKKFPTKQMLEAFLNPYCLE